MYAPSPPKGSFGICEKSFGPPFELVGRLKSLALAWLYRASQGDFCHTDSLHSLSDGEPLLLGRMEPKSGSVGIHVLVRNRAPVTWSKQ